MDCGRIQISRHFGISIKKVLGMISLKISFPLRTTRPPIRKQHVARHTTQPIRSQICRVKQLGANFPSCFNMNPSLQNQISQLLRVCVQYRVDRRVFVLSVKLMRAVWKMNGKLSHNTSSFLILALKFQCTSKDMTIMKIFKNSPFLIHSYAAQEQSILSAIKYKIPYMNTFEEDLEKIATQWNKYLAGKRFQPYLLVNPMHLYELPRRNYAKIIYICDLVFILSDKNSQMTGFVESICAALYFMACLNCRQLPDYIKQIFLLHRQFRRAILTESQNQLTCSLVEQILSHAWAIENIQNAVQFQPFISNPMKMSEIPLIDFNSK